MKIALTIAGFDPSSGAGVTADLMVFAAHRLFGTSCITALTVQSTVGVAGSYPVEAHVIEETLEHLCGDLPPAGIKIGMLATPEIVSVVAGFIERSPGVPIVLDPVLRSSSRRELLTAEGLRLLRERLLPLVTVLTPNLTELASLSDRPVASRHDMAKACSVLRKSYPQLAVFAKGGHLEKPDDLLMTSDGEEHWIPGIRIATHSTHGTGCALASAMLCRLIEGEDVRKAAISAKNYVAGALRAAVPIGSGNGPMNHLWPLRSLVE